MRLATMDPETGEWVEVTEEGVRLALSLDVAEARAEPPRIVTLAWDATAEDVARIRRDWEAAAEARAEGLDVEHPDCGDRCACYVRGVDDEAEATRD